MNIFIQYFFLFFIKIKSFTGLKATWTWELNIVHLWVLICCSILTITLVVSTFVLCNRSNESSIAGDMVQACADTPQAWPSVWGTVIQDVRTSGYFVYNWTQYQLRPARTIANEANTKLLDYTWHSSTHTDHWLIPANIYVNQTSSILNQLLIREWVFSLNELNLLNYFLDVNVWYVCLMC